MRAVLAACLYLGWGGVREGRAQPSPAGAAIAAPADASAARQDFPGPELRTITQGRFVILATSRDLTLARAMLRDAVARDTFPGLPRPRALAVIAIAPDLSTFRDWVGPGAPEWGAAIAIPALNRIVMRGSAVSGRGPEDPRSVLRHELAHLALHEALDGLPPRWFDEGYASYAAGEWGRDEVLATNLIRGIL